MSRPKLRCAVSRNRHKKIDRSGANIQTGGSKTASELDRLAGLYPTQVTLKEEAVYALPSGLIDALACEAKGLWNADDTRFEHDLAKATTCGFFRGERFSFPPLETGHGKEIASTELDGKSKQSIQNIRDMLIEDMRDRGASPGLIQDYFRFAEIEDNTVDERRWSYAGWLATSPDFRRQRDTLRLRDKSSRGSSILPRLPISFAGYAEFDAGSARLRDEWLFLYRSWGIENLATWDLPIPMRAEISTPSLYSLSDLSGAGLFLFIPWFLVRDRNLSLYEIAKRQQLIGLHPCLQDWLDAKPKNWGHKRYTVMLKVYVYLELCLKRRYANRVRGRIAAIDAALTAYLLPESSEGIPRSDDTIRKIRQEMNRRLMGH
jgi:hypothetical protein